MTEYELLNRVLSFEYKSIKQDSLVEKKANHEVKLNVSGPGHVRHTVYRFDRDEKEFLPFFNRNHSDDRQPKTPEGLLAFCDYVILAEYDQKPYVILVEMKSGNTSNVNQQLEASRIFMEYVINSAARICAHCDCRDFQIDHITFRKVLLTKKPANVNRRKTGVKNGVSHVDWHANPIVFSDNIMPVNRFCQFPK